MHLAVFLGLYYVGNSIFTDAASNRHCGGGTRSEKNGLVAERAPERDDMITPESKYKINVGMFYLGVGRSRLFLRQVARTRN